MYTILSHAKHTILSYTKHINNFTPYKTCIQFYPIQNIDTIYKYVISLYNKK